MFTSYNTSTLQLEYAEYYVNYTQQKLGQMNLQFKLVNEVKDTTLLIQTYNQQQLFPSIEITKYSLSNPMIATGGANYLF